MSIERLLETLSDIMSEKHGVAVRFVAKEKGERK